MLVQAGIHHGTVLKFRMHFRPSTELKTLRHSRRHSQTQVARKTLSLQIRKLHRRELRLWRSRYLATLLKYVSCWKTLRENLPRPSGRRSAQQPPVDEFASMLEALFVGPPAQASKLPSMLDPPWTWADLMQAIKRLKINKASDDCGLTAELLKVAPDEYLIAMLDAFNFILRTGQIPASWKLTLFTMLPKKVHSIQTSDFRPIANIRLFYKVFAYMVLNRIENVLELEQPEEQHGFRPGRRIEEHLLTTNILLDKATAAGRTIWIVSLDLSKAFDRVHWPALWAALHDQGVSEHCIWLLQHIYDQQIGEVVGEWGRSRNFAITAGVKQGCVLSPRLFSATLEWALRSWENASQGAGIDLGDGLPNLMELRFADDILLFANSGPEAAQLLDKLITAVGRAGLILNAEKNGSVNQPSTTASNTCDKGWCCGQGTRSQSRTKMARMHVNSCWEYGTER